MITFENILQETYKFQNDLDSLQKIIQKNCKQFLAGDRIPKIYRGIDSGADPDKYILAFPNKTPRRSQNTSNYYTLYINNAPEWAEFPKREIICTTNINKAKVYGDVFVVVPFDNAKIGVVPAKDIWIPFQKRAGMSGEPYDRLEDLFEKIEELYEEGASTKDLHKELTDKNYETFKKQALSLTIEAFKNKYREEAIGTSWEPEAWVKQMMGEMNGNGFSFFLDSKCNSLFEYFQKIFNPKGFVICNYNDVPGGNHEVWTDSPCVLIHRSEFYKAVPKKIQNLI